MKSHRLIVLAVIAASSAVGATAALALTDHAPQAAAQRLSGLDGHQAAAPAYVVTAAAQLSEEPAEVPDELLPGHVDEQDAHLLLSDLGSSGASLYAMPTSKGQVCWVITNGPASCVDAFDADMPAGWAVYDIDGVGVGQPAAVTGLVPDEVETVGVVVNGISRNATVANNGFYYESEKTSDVPQALELSFSDGSSRMIELTGALATPADQP